MADPFAVLDATWPAKEVRDLGPLRIRLTQGAGSRVSAITLESNNWCAADVEQAASIAEEAGQAPCFMVRGRQDDLDKHLKAKNYILRDKTLLYQCPVARLVNEPPRHGHMFRAWPMLAAQQKIWSDGGIGLERLEVMHRAKGPKVTILGRINEMVAGTAFVAMAGETAMIHAIEVTPKLRRNKCGTLMLRAAASWAQDNGAVEMLLAVTSKNAPARAAYTSAGMQVVGSYHYRVMPQS